ncbi:OLC1v1025112C1 [Oldenlandia corymbosa var. corymbosa]|uniref:OLC1v1025112C1 n=1 Tax=Oldenlandia corymbosa var. corymbosa TaxID=529605 RepID=A0AAV1C438_OLDCO|nr:OLC1v1025112C1 [Oldenlandia corymbosa var. corymbosa]
MKRKFHQEEIIFNRKTMKKCELCRRVATTHCESDQAILCWTCDYKVHAANFLVTRHSRTLLCRICQSPTPWSAAGTMLGPAVSVCTNCARNCRNKNRGKAGCTDSHVEIESDGSSDEAEAAVNSSEEEEEIGLEDNRMLQPWSATTTPPPAASSSTSSNSDAESFCSRSSASSSSRSLRRRRKTTHQKKHSLPGDIKVDVPPGSVAVAAVDCSGGQRSCQRSLKRRRLLDPSRVGLSPTFSCSNEVR